ncbi:thiamine phosphate synthase [Oharaeibacter diazotrophicus]|uniref:Thiamine-phosphate pyrophosphorylase n=1 Tax=Oharaeibacter diazotrophicus TaxID=1920512 RepID=A0A4R6RFF0_9HYPH|nr:thiamine phosphate synthase [Oharaeibacter diazotrophicus]TDP85111.1 thiamine-phosphate pyrophosphorylase [Oharaeibacter diazotrophicus]BBE74081.1 thiamine-phosphate pyrophosphorylase [Pleomorphomonas sp. SM30]GLS76231.1 thiamine phosphate synthase [Oharaeibacter diazotrophicus]
MRARLFLITPETVDLAAFLPALDAALAGGDVASLLITPQNDYQTVCEALTPRAQARDVAVLVVDDSRVMGRAKADGLHVAAGPAALAEAIGALQPKAIVGAGVIKTRHEAMAAGEAGADYVFFGMLDKPEESEAHRKTLDLGGWWAELFEPPCVLLAGTSEQSVADCAATGADFVAVRHAVWDHPDGPGAAVTALNAVLDRAAGAAGGRA